MSDEVKLIVTVRRDQVAGAFNTDEGIRDVVARTLAGRLGHYNPIVTLYTTPPEDRIAISRTPPEARNVFDSMADELDEARLRQQNQ